MTSEVLIYLILEIFFSASIYILNVHKIIELNITFFFN
ncbi:hypothetical protein PFNF54_01233 [Plasmodium falciparum NF54]|uniref:Uncharacterized protein n=1 Tax=Plasmodium falciparum (isolate NF54) TaxID=5843 RepID=W7K989_PLAFO|nr:hypothetical protein PFNF54_01233 [Plasmodium falciparum NF54]